MKDYKFYIILGIIALVVVLIIAILISWRKYRIKKIGKDGEKKVAGILKKFAGIRSFKVINDLYLPLYDKTTQIDHILIGFFGILVIETKNLGGQIYGDPRKKDWTQIMGNKRHKLYNPLMQNQAHIDCIRHIFGEENLYNINIESLVVFTNRKAELYIPKGLPVLPVKRLKKFLHQPRFQKDTGFDVEKHYDCLMKHQVTDKKKIGEHVKNVKEMAKNNR